MALAAEAVGDGVEIGVVQRVRGLVLGLGLGLGLVLFGLARLGHAGTSGAVLAQAGMPATTRKSLSVPRSWIIVPVRGLLVPDPAFRHDLRYALGVARVEIVSAFEDFEDVFVIGQSDQRGALGAEFGDIKRRVEGSLLGVPPLEIATNAVLAPRRGVGVVIIKRRAAIGEERGGHAGSVALDGHCVQRRILIGGIGRGYG